MRLTAPLPITDFLFEVGAGRVKGVHPINKFGFDPDTGTEDEVVSPVGPIVVPLTHRVHHIQSDSVEDTGDVFIEGIDGDYNYQTGGETVNVNGVIGNDTITSYRFIHRMRYKGHGLLLPNQGIVSAMAELDVTETAQIPALFGQTQSALFLIPDTVDGRKVQVVTMTNFAGGLARVGGQPKGALQLWELPFGECWQRQEKLLLGVDNPQPASYEFNPPRTFQPKSWVRLTFSSATLGQQVLSSFQIQLDTRN